MKLNKVVIRNTVNKAILKTRKHGPEIGLVFGVAGVVGSTIMACVATAKVVRIAEDSKYKKEGDWYKVKSGEDEGYISKEFVSDTEKTVSRSAEPRTTSENSLNKTNKDEQVVEETNKNNEETSHTNSTTTKGEEVVAYAKQYLGCPYVYGAAGSKSFDCSGFTMYVYKHFGINLPHGANTTGGLMLSFTAFGK